MEQRGIARTVLLVWGLGPLCKEFWDSGSNLLPGRMTVVEFKSFVCPWSSRWHFSQKGVYIEIYLQELVSLHTKPLFPYLLRLLLARDREKKRESKLIKQIRLLEKEGMSRNLLHP